MAQLQNVYKQRVHIYKTIKKNCDSVIQISKSLLCLDTQQGQFFNKVSLISFICQRNNVSVEKTVLDNQNQTDIISYRLTSTQHMRLKACFIFCLRKVFVAFKAKKHFLKDISIW